MIELRAELDRVVTFEGEVLNSAIIHGTDQRWSKVRRHIYAHIHLHTHMETLNINTEDIQ